MSNHTATPPRTPLGSARVLPPSLPRTKSNGTLARQFVDRHSTTYAHLFEHSDDAIRREKLEAEQRKLEEERRRGREMRERMSSAEGKENSPLFFQGQSFIGKGLPGGAGESRGRGSWRPLSLVAKRQNIGLGHARSASHQIPSTLPSTSTIRSVSHTPTNSSSLAPRGSTPPLTSNQSLEVVIENSRPNSPNPPSSSSHSSSDHTHNDHDTHEGDVTHDSEPKSTYSWATSFSGETAELRATATYLRQSLDESAVNIPISGEHQTEKAGDEEEVLDTPEKIKRRRKRIVAIAHTVRQLEGVGSREAEDPNFYGELVKAWNERPGFKPVHAAPPIPVGLTDAPPALLPPPNLYPPPQAYGRYSALAFVDPPPMSPAFERHFGTPPTPYLFTPATAYDSTTAPSSSTFPPPQEVYDYDDDESDASVGDLRTRSYRYSYASALHDLALEGGAAELEQGASGKGVSEKAWLKAPLRWSGAWEGWGSGPAPPPSTSGKKVEEEDEEQTIDWSRHQHLQQQSQPVQSDAQAAPPNPLDTALYPPALSAAIAAPPLAEGDKGWGLGFMSAWWTDRPIPSPPLAVTGTPEPRPPHSQDASRGPDFQRGECEQPHLTPSPHPSHARRLRRSGLESEEMGESSSTPGHEQHQQDTSFNTSSESMSGVSTPSFGMRIHASAERRWARPTMVHAGQSRSLSHGILPSFEDQVKPDAQPRPTTQPSWLVSIPMETTSSINSLDSVHPHSRARDMPTTDSTSSNLTSTSTAKGEEREFPFSSHCRPPSCTNIPSSTDSTVSVPSEIHLLRAEVALAQMEEGEEWLQEVKEDRSLGGLVNGSFPSTRTLRPMMFRQQPGQMDQARDVEQERQSQGLLERRHVRPLMLGEMLNPVSGQDQKLHIEPQSSTSHLDTPTTNLSLAPTPTSIQTHFIPPPTTPVLPLTPTTPSDTSAPSMMSEADMQTRQIFYRTRDDTPPRRHIYPSEMSPPRPDQNYDHSSYPCGSNGPSGDTLPAQPEGQDRVRAGTGMLDLRGQPTPCRSTGRSTPTEVIGVESEAVVAEQSGGYRDPTPSVITMVIKPAKRRGVAPAVLFWLGFIMPWCWIFGGWPVRSSMQVENVDEEKGEVKAEVRSGWLARWVYHPDPWARRSRIAAVGVLPLAAMVGVVGVIVLGVMRGR